MEVSFCELRSKIVINLIDGKKLGNITDIVFDQGTAKVLGLVVPCSKGFLSFFKPQQDIFIPYHCICRIGEDTILVELTTNFSQKIEFAKENKPEPYVGYRSISQENKVES